MAFVGGFAKAIPGLCQHGGSVLDTRKIERTSLYWQPSATIGELQHAYAEGRIDASDMRFIGDVITKEAPGRLDDQQITIFDSNGVGLQDLVAAHLALTVAGSSGGLRDMASDGGRVYPSTF